MIHQAFYRQEARVGGRKGYLFVGGPGGKKNISLDGGGGTKGKQALGNKMGPGQAAKGKGVTNRAHYKRELAEEGGLGGRAGGAFFLALLLFLICQVRANLNCPFAPPPPHQSRTGRRSRRLTTATSHFSPLKVS